MSNTVLERIHRVIGNLVQTCNITHQYVDKDEPWLGILASAAFAILSTTNRLKGYILVQLRFFCDIILLVNIQWIRYKYVIKIKRKLFKI